MKSILLITLFVSTSAFAAEKCRDAVAKQIPKSATLLEDAAVVLKPGEESFIKMGEIWNDQKETLEYYGYEKSNGYYGVYTAVGASLKDCKLKRIIDLGDDA
ncbi:MAG: hypothetical protein ACJ76H_10835 [Bacteriovoracaceae bacterium]